MLMEVEPTQYQDYPYSDDEQQAEAAAVAEPPSSASKVGARVITFTFCEDNLVSECSDGEA